jgi:hypothetical protein
MPSDDCITLTTSADADASSPLLPTPSSPEGLVDLRGGTLSVHPDGEHYSYAYGPTGLAGLCANTYTLRCAVFASLGGLTFGYDQGVIANVLVMQDFRTRWPVGPWELGLMSTCSHDDYLTRGARLNVVRSQRRCSSWVVSSACWPQACSRTGSRGGPRLRRPAVRVSIPAVLSLARSHMVSESYLLRGLGIADVGTLLDATHGRKGNRWHWRWRVEVWPS